MKGLACALLAALVLGGCLSTTSSSSSSTDPGPGPGQIPAAREGTYYHGADETKLDGDNPQVRNGTVFATAGGYQSIGQPVFEPSMGITSDGDLFVASFRDAPPALQYTFVIRSQDHGVSWTNVGPFIPGTDLPVVLNSNDPFMTVDPYTDRIVKFDMCATLAAFCVEYSDDGGDTWLLTSVATGEQPALDHQSLAYAPSAEPLSTVYPTTGVFCVNRGTTITGAWCSSTFDGGIVWTPLVPGFPLTSTQCSGLHGHIKAGRDGVFYRGNPSCEGPAVYRSADGGLTWTEHTIPDTVGGSLGHEITVDVDSVGNVHAFWMNGTGQPFLASSKDGGQTWTTPKMVGAPGVTAAGFPALAAGDEGRVAFAYIGTKTPGGYDTSEDEVTWNGYLGVVTDAFAEDLAISSVQVNADDDPLDTTASCGAVRCGGFGDFISAAIDPIGRPYAIMSHNEQGNTGIIVTTTDGPALRGELKPLPHLELDGARSFA